MSTGQHFNTVRRVGWAVRLLIVVSFFMLWKRFDMPAIEALKYCFSAYLILHALLRVLRPIARVFDRARTRGMIVVGILKFLDTILLPTLWKGMGVPFWQALLICGVIYFVLDCVWRYLESRALRAGAIAPPPTRASPAA